MRDPALDTLPAASVHFLVGTTDGRCLAYTCLQPAGEETPPPNLPLVHGRAPVSDRREQVVAHCLTDVGRPLFPTERELFGSHVFASLPGLRDIPVERMREWACSFRNQVVQSPLSTAALFAAFSTPLLFAADPLREIEVILGNNNKPARKIYAELGLAVLYAPLVPVIPPNDDGYWMPVVNEQGHYWPGVLALADLRAHNTILQRVD